MKREARLECRISNIQCSFLKSIFDIRYSIFFLLLLSSCVQHKQLLTFPEEHTNFSATEELLNAVELHIQPDDLLRITVFSADVEAAAPFNIEPIQQQNNMQMFQQQGQGSQSNYPPELLQGYFVDREGNINLPYIGPLEVEGLTLAEAENLIAEKVKPYLNDGVVNVRFLNFKITVLGEVQRPGTIRISNQRVNLLDALGMAGDFTPYANRTNVLLIREKDGKREYQRFNFQNETVIHSPYFYLQQNDVIYVEPLRARVATVQDPFARGVTYGTAILTVITLMVAIFQ
jgi:polysaccharide export outer membrane protein